MLYLCKSSIIFAVAHRYLGEEESGSVSKEARSQALLVKLQEKAKEKQKQSLIEHSLSPPNEHTERKKVKKKRKSEIQEPQHHKKRRYESDNDKEFNENRKKDKRHAKEKTKKKDQSGVYLCLTSLIHHMNSDIKCSV